MKYTGNLKLLKPDGSETFDIEHANQNMDILDKKVGGLSTELSSHKAENASYNEAGHIKLKDIPQPVIATKLESEAGTNNTKMMTPLRVKESVDSNPLWDNTKGSKSNEWSTGKVSTDNLAQVNVSSESLAEVIWSQVNASNKSKSTGSNSQVNGSIESSALGAHTQVNVSNGVLTESVYNSVWGYAGVTEPSTQNRKVEISSMNGTIKASGAITGNSSFADFAEYFESADGKAIPLGTIVSLGEGGKIKVAKDGEYMVGVISQTAGVILNAQGFEWKDRYLYDRYGQPILVDKEIINEETGEVEIIKTQMLNVNWNEDEEYVGREDREEWNVVGLTGQIFVNVDDTVREGDFIKVKDNGIGTKGKSEYGQNWQVMKVTTAYEERLGFGIALVFVR